jgi:PTH1 family peptidyl-tRNA hydrolase
MTLFVGLGNPGANYKQTRHNIGFQVIDRLVERFEAQDVSKNSFHGELYKAGQLLFLKPATFMNLSGKSVQAVLSFYKITLDHIVVIHDDLDLPFGAIRFKKGGGNGGHNGLKSIDSMISKEYLRIRMGIAKPLHKSQVADYVLHEFTAKERERLGDWIAYAVRTCEAMMHEPLDQVASQYSLKSIENLPA